MSGYADSEKIQYALKTALYRTMQTSMSDSASVERSAPLRVFPTNIMKVNIIEAGKGDIGEDGTYVTGHATAGQTADLSDPESTVKNYKIICPVNNVITDKTISWLVGYGSSTKSYVDGRGTSGTSYPLKQWFFRGHYSGSGEAAFNAANVTYDGLQLAWNSATNGATPSEADIVPHLKYYLQVQTNYTGVSHSSSADNITYEHGLLKGLIGLDSNFVSTIMVTQGEGGPSSSASLGTSGSQAGDFWFTQPTAGVLSFYGVTNKVDASTDLATANFATKYPMVSYVRYTGETGFGAGTGGGGATQLISNDTNVSNMIGGTAQTMTTTSFEFDGDVNITGDLSVTGSGAGTFKGVHNASYNNILVHGNNSWNSGLTGVYNTSLGWSAGQSLSGGSTNGNTLIGYWAGLSITTGQYNIALGQKALMGCSTGSRNIAIGNNAMGSSIGNDGYCIAIGETAMQYYGRDAGTATNRYDIAIGYQAMYGSHTNSGGEYNVAIGHQALRQVTTALSNVAIGRQAGYNTTTGYSNVFMGTYAGKNLTTSYGNVCIGANAGKTVTSSNNVYVGYQAGESNNTSGPHTFIGHRAGQNVVSSWNVAVGHYAGQNGMGNYNVAMGDNAFANGAHSSKHYTTAIGYCALQYATHANNTAVGYCAGRDITSGQMNVFIGSGSGRECTTGSGNVAIGYDPMGSLSGDVTGQNNVAIGKHALRSLTSGGSNIAIGWQCGYNSTSCSGNSFLGHAAAQDLSTGSYNTCIGYCVGYKLTTGSDNTFVGSNIARNTSCTGGQNVAIGHDTFYKLTSGEANIALGYQTGYNTTSGYNNIYMGYQAGYSATTANYNVAIGYMAAQSYGTNSQSVAIGYLAGQNSNKSYCTFVGSQAGRYCSQTYNVAIGYYALYNAANNYNVAIGDEAISTGSNTSKSSNVAVGYQALKSVTHYNNVAVGEQAGKSVTSGSDNVYIGYQAGRLSTTGAGNTVVGSQSMGTVACSSNYNTIMGRQAGTNLTSGSYNTYIGKSCAPAATTGSYNTCIGRNAGNVLTTANSSVLLGNYVAAGVTTGSENIMIGQSAGNRCSTGSKNIMIGQQTWNYGGTQSATNMICIGNGVGPSNTDTTDSSYELFIGSHTNNYHIPGHDTYIYGYMKMDDNPFIRFNGKVGIGTSSPQTELTVKGSDNGGISIIRSADNYHWRIFNNNNNTLTFQGRNSDNNIRSGCDDLLVLHDSGKVGIGTDNPSSIFHIKDTSPILRIESTSGDVNGRYAYIEFLDSGGAFAWMGDGSGGDKAFYIYASDGQPIALMNGHVGIGTASPSYPLHVATWVDVGTNWAAVGYMYYNSVSYTSGADNDDICIKADQDIWAGGYLFASSDRRIKYNIEDVPDNLALDMVRNIPCRYYEYKDKILKSTGKTIGFIAQEVKEIMPMAVSTQKAIIPNEMRILEISWEEIIDGSNNAYKLTSDLQDVSGIKYKFYVCNDPSGNEYMKEIVGNSDNTFTFEEKWNNVFCYGKEVDDFHTLTKEKLFTLNFSATQELDRKVIALENENAELKTKVATLESELAAIKQHLGI